MVGILICVEIVAGSFWIGRDWRKCHSCGAKFRSAFLGRWRARGTLQVYNYMLCDVSRKKWHEDYKAEFIKQRDGLKRISEDPTVPVRQSLKARYKLIRK